jgi:asparagine synthase (glutamine-hydrolysing)
MCGLAAFLRLSSDAPELSRKELLAVRDAMASRGPDGAGEWWHPTRRVALGHRRLAILDRSARSDQPMASRETGSALAYNGELYDFAALGAQWSARTGRELATTSDTEVLLRLLEERGEAALAQLRGMFAFAFWDERRAALLVARDHFGIKPLYWSCERGVVRVASQVRALEACGALSRERDPAAEAGFLLLGSVPEPFTWRRAIRALPAGHALWFDERGVFEPRPWVHLADEYRAAERAAAERVASGAGAPGAMEIACEVAAAVAESVRVHFTVSDVPVGCFLSAGVDSGALLALASAVATQPVRTLTLGFEEFAGTPDDEVPLAEEAARRSGADHHTHRLTRAEFERELPRLLASMDQPSIDGVNTWFVSKAAHERGLVVALSGLGGDELLGGYPSFADVPRWVRRAAPVARVPGLARLARYGAGLVPGLSPKASGFLEFAGDFPGAWFLRRGLFLPHELPQVLGRERARVGLERLAPLAHIREVLGEGLASDWSRVSLLESSLYMRNQLLRDTDWASMAHALEVRVPLVDIALWRRTMPLLAGARELDGKGWLGAAPATPLPEHVVRRRKTGFRVPIEQWLESGAALDGWRRVPSLARPGTPWARRLACALLDLEAA